MNLNASSHNLCQLLIKSRTEWNRMKILFCYRYFSFCPKAILYPSLGINNLDLGIPNPTLKLAQKELENNGPFHSIPLRVLVVTNLPYKVTLRRVSKGPGFELCLINILFLYLLQIYFQQIYVQNPTRDVLSFMALDLTILSSFFP